MDIFKSMNQTKVADFSVFKPKKKNPVTAEEQNEQNPVPQKETVAGRMTEKTVLPIKEEIPVEQDEKQRLNWRLSWKLQRVIFCRYFPLSDI